MTETCIAYTVGGRCGSERVRAGFEHSAEPVITIKIDKRYCVTHGLMMDFRDPLGRHYVPGDEGRPDDSGNYWLE